MPADANADAPAADLFLVGELPDRLADRGPRYKETPPDPLAPDAPLVAEPWNAVTASFFVLIVCFWAWRLRGRFRDHPFVTGCLPVLLVGGVGGTLYHAFRTRPLYFFLDVIPIQLLGAAAAIYLCYLLTAAFGRLKVMLAVLGLLAGIIAINVFAFRLIQLPTKNGPVNLSYASLALAILLPMGVVLWRTRFRHVGFVAAGLGCFAIAWFCRLVDGTAYGDLPMGTHWLWHTFGAATTLMVTEYFYLIEKEGL